MCERLVGLGHLVRVFTFLYRCASSVSSIDDLSSKTLFHRLFASQTRIVDDPSQSQRQSSLSGNFHRHLIVRTADTASLQLEQRHYVFQCFFKHFHRLFTGLHFNDIKRVVQDLLCNSSFSINHDLVN